MLIGSEEFVLFFLPTGGEEKLRGWGGFLFLVGASSADRRITALLRVGLLPKRCEGRKAVVGGGA